jgi:hypothetical protein
MKPVSIAMRLCPRPRADWDYRSSGRERDRGKSDSRDHCCRDDVPAAALGLQAVLAHEPADLLAVDDKTLVAQLGADPPIAVSLALVADDDNFRDELHVAYRCGRQIIESGARQSHQTAFRGRKVLGAADDGCSRASRPRCVFFSAPFRNSISSACLPTMHLKGGDLRLVFLKQIGRFGIFVEGARFELHHPNADQVARDAMTCGESVKRLAGDELLRHQAF